MIDTMRRTTAAVVILVLAAVVSGCLLDAGGGARLDADDRAVAPRPDLQLTCFNVRNVRRYAALHERYVYVRVRSNEHYC